MNRKWLWILFAAFPVIAWAQNSPSGSNSPPYQPAVPAPSMSVAYGGWPGNTGASTAAGSAMNGMASMISAKGDYNLSTSAAAINWTQAQSQELQNRQQATDTYFSMRATNKAAQEKERGPRVTMEQIAHMARDFAPRPLNTGEQNPVSGQLSWPGPLQDPMFASRRTEVDRFMGQQAHYGGLPYADQTKVREIINTMFKDLKSQVSSIPSQQYVEARSFLNSVLFASTKTQLS